LDESTVESPDGAVRGGIPLLFPFAGELTDGVLNASRTSLPRHGFARRRPWTVVARSSDTLIMLLPADAEIAAQYPFAFDVTYEVIALARGVRINLRVHNRGPQPLPLAPGWHPYFPCAADRKRACL